VPELSISEPELDAADTEPCAVRTVMVPVVDSAPPPL
jgi:hypothetical protein